MSSRKVSSGRGVSSLWPGAWAGRALISLWQTRRRAGGVTGELNHETRDVPTPARIPCAFMACDVT